MLKYKITNVKQFIESNKVSVEFDYTFVVKSNDSTHFGRTVDLKNNCIVYDYSDNSWELEFETDGSQYTLFSCEVELFLHLVDLIKAPSFKVLYT